MGDHPFIFNVHRLCRFRIYGQSEAFVQLCSYLHMIKHLNDSCVCAQESRTTLLPVPVRKDGVGVLIVCHFRQKKNVALPVAIDFGGELLGCLWRVVI